MIHWLSGSSGNSLIRRRQRLNDSQATSTNGKLTLALPDFREDLASFTTAIDPCAIQRNGEHSPLGCCFGASSRRDFVAGEQVPAARIAALAPCVLDPCPTLETPEEWGVCSFCRQVFTPLIVSPRRVICVFNTRLKVLLFPRHGTSIPNPTRGGVWRAYV